METFAVIWWHRRVNSKAAIPHTLAVKSTYSTRNRKGV